MYTSTHVSMCIIHTYMYYNIHVHTCTQVHMYLHVCVLYIPIYIIINAGARLSNAKEWDTKMSNRSCCLS